MGLKQVDKQIYDWIQKEAKRQKDHVELIASEIMSRVPSEVLKAPFSPINMREGYPQKRYYGACNIVDEIETLAIERAKQLFHVGFANVQPHSGSQAQHGCLPGHSSKRRFGLRHVAVTRRTPNPRHEPQLFR
jgi:glycine hydroxymethyltransferase